VAASSKEPVPPADLPEGTSLLDLPDVEVAERASFNRAIFDALRSEIESFVAAGCPVKRDKKLRTTMANLLATSFATYRGAEEWRAAREDDLQRAIEDFGPERPVEEMPTLIRAALFVAAAKDAENLFRATILKHMAALKAAEEKKAKKAPRARRP
jgi:hypothetical protein